MMLPVMCGLGPAVFLMIFAFTRHGEHGIALLMDFKASWCKRFFIFLLVCGLVAGVSAAGVPVVIDDMAILKSLPKDIGILVDTGKATSGEALAAQLEKKMTKKAKLPQGLMQENGGEKKDIYMACAESVGVITSVYKCSKCTNWQSSGAATAWILTSEGVMVTNYHVFEGKKVEGFGVRTLDGKVFPVVEIIAASKKDDVAIFRVKGSGFKPLSLGADAQVGSDVHIIAHPDSKFYTYTQGKVSRYFRANSKKRSGVVQMAVTAEFARGSSGGPVLNSAGNVVGMVCSTQSIYYPPKKKADKKGPFQMVIRQCVPVKSIRSLIEKN